MNSPDTLIADRVAGTASSAPVRAWYRRFTRTERILHAFLMLSFVACALTGLPLLFADRPWAPVLAQLLGGFRSAGVIHRIAATVMIGVFSTHLLMLVQRAVAKRNFLGMIWGPESMVPQPQDIIDIWNNFKWFIGRGPRPTFDRWTYWEKFDYWAVFWGMFIIGGSGLLLWFPFFFGKFIPGWMFNIAALIHGEEALLAVGFIFTIHFFNGHLRPEKFPMDVVVFTGRMSGHELAQERTRLHDRLAASGQLESEATTEPTLESRAFGWFIGGAALLLGIVAIVLILYSMAN